MFLAPASRSRKVPGPFPVVGLLPEGSAQGAQEGQTDVFEAVPGLPPRKWKVESWLSKREKHFSVFFFSNLVRVFQRKEGSGVEAQPCWREKAGGGSSAALDLPRGVDHLPGPQPPVTGEGEAALFPPPPSPLLPRSVLWNQRHQNSQMSGDGGLGHISHPQTSSAHGGCPGLVGGAKRHSWIRADSVSRLCAFVISGSTLVSCTEESAGQTWAFSSIYGGLSCPPQPVCPSFPSFSATPPRMSSL